MRYGGCIERGERLASHNDLKQLCETALANGAVGAKVLGVRGVVMDPRVRLKCMVPTCANYGRNLMCPPNTMPMDEFAQVLKRYLHVIVVQYPIPLDQTFMERSKGKKLEDIYEGGEYFQRLLKSETEFMDILGSMEKTALELGYRFAAAFTGGPCRLCDECVGQGSGERCRHPFRSRPSMEAMGIDVFLTAKNAGLPFEIPAKDRPVWTGMVLID